MADRPVYPPAFHDVLAGTAHVAQGESARGGTWQVWADPDDRDPCVYAIEIPPADQGGAVALARFEPLLERPLVVTLCSRGARGTFVTATADAEARTVVVTDVDGATIDLARVYSRPWWSHQLFAGSTGERCEPDHATAYDGDGRPVAHQDLSWMTGRS